MKALITGGSRGIGRAIAEQLAQAGFELLLVSRNETRLSRTARDLQARGKLPVDSFPCDLADLKQVDRLFQHCQKLRFVPDVLVHSAGIFIEGSVSHSEPEVLTKQFDVHVLSMYYLTKLLLPAMRKKKAGRIIIIGSTAGLEDYPTGALYGISKWATRGYAVNLREELKDAGIGVTLVSLGGTFTDIWAEDELPPKRLMPASDIGKLVRCAVSLEPESVVEEIVVRPQLGDIH